MVSLVLISMFGFGGITLSEGVGWGGVRKYSLVGNVIKRERES